LTEIFGAGPVIAATIIGATGQVSRFASRGRFAACNGTAPIEASPGPRKIYRLSRRVNHAIHMAAVTQLRNKHSDGRACFDQKLAEGTTRKKRCAPSSAASATPSTPTCKPAPGAPAH
jgi:transposase